MSALINDPEAHWPHGPKFGFGYLEKGDLPSGEFYQPPAVASRRDVEKLIEQAKSDSQFHISIDDYQAWAEFNWKEPHGTVSSINRFSAKLLEEFQELKNEVTKPADNVNKTDLARELGDLLWCTTALASDLRINVKHALMNLMDLYGHHVRDAETGRPPEWVREAQALTFDDQMKASGIDELVVKGYQPQEAAIMLVDDIEEVTQIEIDDAVSNLDLYTRFLNSIARSNYEENLYQTGATQQSETAAYFASRIYLDVAFLARHCADSSLPDVMRDNIIKLSRRVDTNTVDKSDGLRQ